MNRTFLNRLVLEYLFPLLLTITLMAAALHYLQLYYKVHGRPNPYPRIIHASTAFPQHAR